MAKPGDVIDNPVTGERITFVRTSRDTDGRLVQFDLVVQPGGSPVGAHAHPVQTERFKVLKGALCASMDGRELCLVEGDELTIPPGTPHYWRNASHETLHVIVELLPALRWEALFETMFGLARDGKTDRRGRPNPLQAAVIFHEFHDEAVPVARIDRMFFALIPFLAPLGRYVGYKPTYARYTNDAA